MDAIIKAMVPIMQEIDPNFMDKIKSKVQEKYRQNSIDDTFVFQNGSKEKFEQADLAQLKQQGNNNLKQKQVKEKIIRQKNKKLMKQKMKLL